MLNTMFLLVAMLANKLEKTTINSWEVEVLHEHC